MRLTEDQLCEIFAEAVKENPAFSAWVLGQTKFARHAEDARLLHKEQLAVRPRKRWWRHWWCRVPELDKDRETDIFMVFETSAVPIFRFSLHIENKRDDYRFNEGQAFAYASRGRHMLGKAEYLNYTDFDTVLIAPLSFRKRYESECSLFNVFISHEAIARFLPEYAV